MDDARNEATSSVASTKMNDVRDKALHGVTSYQKGKKIFERGNGFKTINFDGNVSSVDTSMCRGSVRDRKKFFETLSSSASQSTAISAPDGSESPSVLEERTDSESFMRNKGDRFGHQRKDSRSAVHNNSERMGPAESSNTELHQKWESKFDWEIDPSEVFEHDPSNHQTKSQAARPSQTCHQNESKNSNPTVGIISLSQSYIQKAKSLDSKILSLPNTGDTDTEEKQGEVLSPSEKDTRQLNEGDNRALRSAEDDTIKTDVVKKKNVPSRPIVKIQVTNTRAENKKSLEDNGERKDASSTICEQKTDIDEVIAEFQQTSAKLSGKSTTTSSRRRLTHDRSADRLNLAEIIQDGEIPSVINRSDTKSINSSFAPNTLTANAFEALGDELQATHPKENANISNYVCPSESTDYSIDSKGNSKATKSISSKSAKSAKSSIRLKVKGNGVGKMLKKAKKGMGKSVKNLTSIVKNSIKTKPTKQPLATAEQSSEEICDQRNVMGASDIFDEKFAEELVKDSRHDAGIVKASQYLDSGNKLLRSKEEMKKDADPKTYIEMTQKAHTYAYVGRQLAKEYLLTCHQEHLKRTETNMSDCAASENDDEVTVIEEFFLSFMQCVGPCARDEDVEHSRRQISGALGILSKLSEEEASVVKNRLSKEMKREILVDRKRKVQGAIVDNRDSTGNDHIVGMEAADRERSLFINGFVSALRSFYETDDTMNLPTIFLKLSEDNKDDASDSSRSFSSGSLSYNYSESLKFDHGQSNSFHTRSFASSAGSTEQEKPSSSHRGRKLKEESLAEGIRPGTTVVSIAVKNKNFRKKKQQSSKKWKGGRKQK